MLEGFHVDGAFACSRFALPLIWPTHDLESAVEGLRSWQQRIGVTMHGVGRLKAVFLSFGGFVVRADDDAKLNAWIAGARARILHGEFPEWGGYYAVGNRRAFLMLPLIAPTVEA